MSNINTTNSAAPAMVPISQGGFPTRLKSWARISPRLWRLETSKKLGRGIPG